MSRVAVPSAADGVTSPGFRPPRARRLELANGASLLWVGQPGTPLLHLKAVICAGAEHDPPGLAGLAALTAPLLKAGAGGRDTTRLAAAVEAAGADVLTRTTWEESSVAIELLADDAELAADLIADLLWRPDFEHPTCESFRQRRIARLRQTAGDPDELARAAFARASYGDGLYGRPLLGDERSLARIGREEIVEFHRRHFVHRGTVLVAVGEGRPDLLARRLDRLLPGGLPPPPPREVPIPAPAATESTVLIDRTHARQTVLRVGRAGPPRHDRDFLRLELLATLLGARLERTLRDRLGHTYGVRRELSSRRGPNALTVALAVATEHAGAALREVLREAERLCREPVSMGEIQVARNGLACGFIRSLQAAHGVAAYLAGLTATPAVDRWQELRGLQGVSPQELLEVAARHLRPESLTAVAVGPARALRGQLAWRGPLCESAAFGGRSGVEP